jgi:hypothetical protein
MYELSLDDWVNVITVIESVSTIIALIIGGVWVYFIFVKNRQHLPHAQVSISTQHRIFAKSKRLIHVSVEIENTGETVLSIGSINVKVQHVAPLSSEVLRDLKRSTKSKEFCWPLADDSVIREYQSGESELEPGEADSYHCDFVIDSSIEVIRLYCYVENIAKNTKSGIGWKAIEFARVRPDSSAIDETQLPADAIDETQLSADFEIDLRSDLNLIGEVQKTEEHGIDLSPDLGQQTECQQPDEDAER